MAEDSFSEEQSAFFRWLEGLDMEQSLADLVGDHPEWTEALQIDSQDLERLDNLAREYVQELATRDALPDTPGIEIDARLLEQARDIDRDFDH